jgi:hypothetical protein
LAFLAAGFLAAAVFFAAGFLAGAFFAGAAPSAAAAFRLGRSLLGGRLLRRLLAAALGDAVGQQGHGLFQGQGGRIGALGDVGVGVAVLDVGAKAARQHLHRLAVLGVDAQVGQGRGLAALRTPAAGPLVGQQGHGAVQADVEHLLGFSRLA